MKNLNSVMKDKKSKQQSKKSAGPMPVDTSAKNPEKKILVREIVESDIRKMISIIYGVPEETILDNTGIYRLGRCTQDDLFRDSYHKRFGWSIQSVFIHFEKLVNYTLEKGQWGS
jgi:hypothetical protein